MSPNPPNPQSNPVSPNPVNPNPAATDDTLLERLLDAVQLPVRMAQQGLGIAQFFCLVNVFSSGWLIFFLWHSYHLPIWLLGIAIAVLLLPGLIMGRLYLLLLEVCGLTDQVTSLLNSAKSTAVESHALISSNLTGKNGQNSKTSQGFQLGNLFSLGGKLLEIKSLGEELLGMSSLTGSMLMLANPLFLGLSAIAIALTLAGALISGITLMIFLF